MLSSGAFGYTPGWGLGAAAATAGGLKRSYPEDHVGGHATSKNNSEAEKPKRKRPKFIRKVTCQVCDDIANDHIHYGAIVCYSCRAFFRRGVTSNAPFYCSQDKQCKIGKATRKHCQYCRYVNISVPDILFGKLQEFKSILR